MTDYDTRRECLYKVGFHLAANALTFAYGAYLGFAGYEFSFPNPGDLLGINKENTYFLQCAYIVRSLAETVDPALFPLIIPFFTNIAFGSSIDEMINPHKGLGHGWAGLAGSIVITPQVFLAGYGAGASLKGYLMSKPG